MKCMFFFLMFLFIAGCGVKDVSRIVEQEQAKQPYIADQMFIDKVWSGHPVYFFLMTEGPRQYFAYYNAERQMVVGMRNLDEDNWVKFMPQTDNKKAPVYGEYSPASTVLGWDSHNYITMAMDKKGYIHMCGNMHVNQLTYFRSTQPYDITTLKQIKRMTGELEDKMTYPRFIKTAEGDIVFSYRYGRAGDGIQIFNIYDADKQQWLRYLDKPLSDGKGLSNGYFLRPVFGPDRWWHISGVWRDDGGCEKNHDLSYAKSPDLKNWYTATGQKIELPILNDTPGIIVDPIPVRGGIMNGSGRVGFDNDDRVVLAYHKFDEQGNTQVYCARLMGNRWQIKQITDWDYRWYFYGPGCVLNDVIIGELQPRYDGYMNLDYEHIKYGKGTWLLNEDLDIVGKFKRHIIPSELLNVESDFPGMIKHTQWDINGNENDPVRYVLTWETLPRNRDLPRNPPLPQPTQLKLIEIRYK